jgi:hypothetical protein
MGINDDFVDNLMNDFLTQVAGNFFETRRLLDHKIEVFYDHVEQLKQLAEKVEHHAAFLNFLLIEDRYAAELYGNLSIPPESFQVGDNVHEDALPTELPGSITAKGRFIKLVEWAFEQLRNACETYTNGDREVKGLKSRKKNPAPVYYQLIQKMHAIINDEIRKINCSMSPSCTLQYARSFDLAASDKEKTFGNTSADLSGLDDKMRYPLIDFCQLNLKQFPVLPSSPKTKAVLTDVARRVYRSNRERVKARLTTLGQHRGPMRKTTRTKGLY